MTRRRIYHAPRGSIGVDLYSFSSTLVSGLPQPFFALAVNGPSTWSSLTPAFEQALHATTNTVQYYQNFNNTWPTSTVSAIASTGRSQMMTLQPATASFNLAGGVRSSDGGVDNPMVSGTTYSGVVITGSLLAGHVTQPSGTYVTLGGVSGGPSGLALSTSVPFTIASGSQIPITLFTPTKNYTTLFTHDLAGIISGNYDSVIQSYATSAAGTGVAVRFAHEMNGNWYPWGTATSGSDFTPAQYVSLWNHFRSVWQAQETSLGTAHVPWVWCPNISNNKGGTPSASGVLTTGSGTGSSFPIYAPSSVGAVGTGYCYYPGDSNCEYIGLDGYSNPSSYNGVNPSFSSLFANDIQWMQSNITTTRPMIIPETGIDVSIGSSARAAWFSGTFTTHKTYSVAGICYFNNVGSGNYPINTDPVACMGFRSSLESWVKGF